MKNKLAKLGLDAFEPHEVLEILLFYAIPQRNTNDIAKNLLDRFGSLSAVFDASLEMLMNAGLTEHQAMLLHMMPGVCRRYLLDKYQSEDKPLDFETYSDYILNKFIGYEERENVLLILLDAKNKIVYSGFVAQGDFACANFSIRELITLAINYGAICAILAHSHPSGVALPSKQDVLATIDVANAFRMVGVKLLDHYIVADHDCTSLAQNGLMDF